LFRSGKTNVGDRRRAVVNKDNAKLENWEPLPDKNRRQAGHVIHPINRAACRKNLPQVRLTEDQHPVRDPNTG
jgi:U3 small nucleolar RNA-associated protein 14